MARNQSPLEKEESLGNVVKVQQVIDFFVLSELNSYGRRYQGQLEESIIKSLSNVGVAKGYLTKRLQKLSAEGYVIRQWEDDDRYNRYYEISDSGLDYFKNMMIDLPTRVKLAQKVYKQFEQYIEKNGL
ncbi:helix-turn-helix transcriptional regulator [Paenibacillus sp. GSMTC-2017]|uniref:helix-turn-helix transcriptional regulator n=1 Tax=Paenibacillus sp. GSMTC-2017 TaxID=2794350 RepID=UPI0018D5FFFA|nr:helix-turn-helix transcriptional regulator [Paenibacillus sp. GSMTC-2017]MBH5317642.1 helix-turn-helix transcriptional regulator [Paenibacillus sp. GSMTC-2017]